MRSGGDPNGVATTGAQQTGLLRSRDPGSDDADRVTAQSGSRRVMGFSVMRSPDRGLLQAGRRIASQQLVNEAGRSTRCRGSGKQGS